MAELLALAKRCEAPVIEDAAQAIGARGSDGTMHRMAGTFGAAGALSFRDALPLVRFRAQAMQEAVPAGEGAMAAILGLEDDAVRGACREAAQGQVVEAVNFNAPSQVVIAGHKAAVTRAIAACKAKGAKRGMPLPVSNP